MNIEGKERPCSILKYETDKNYSREVVTVASGQNLKMGMVVGIKSETGEVKVVSIADDETDGSDTAIGVVLQNIDATATAKNGLIVARNAIVIGDKIIYPQGTTIEQKKKILIDLEKRGIIVRQEA